MKHLSGEVAFLKEDGTVDRIKDLGPKPVGVADNGRVFPLVHEQSEIKDGEVLSFDRFEVRGDHVAAVYKTETIPLPDRVLALENKMALLLEKLGIKNG